MKLFKLNNRPMIIDCTTGDSFVPEREKEELSEDRYQEYTQMMQREATIRPRTSLDDIHDRLNDIENLCYQILDITPRS